MRQIVLGRSGIRTSCLGFGCASLGSLVDADTGRNALAEAYKSGVTWFDLAPVYGSGRAEEIAGPFLRARRSEVQICTKAGLKLAGGARGGLRRLAMPVARRLLSAAGPLGVRLRKAAPAANAKTPLTPKLILESLEGSLKRIGTDYVDLFALHNATPEDLARDDIRRTLEDIIASGKARAAAVASDADTAPAVARTGDPYSAVQFPLPPPGVEHEALESAVQAGLGVVAHTVFGGEDGPWPALRTQISRNPALAERLGKMSRWQGDADNSAGLVARLRIMRAFALNPDGVVLVSMFSRRSLQANALAAGIPPEAASALPGALDEAVERRGTPVLVA